MRSNVENRQQPLANELVESLLVRWGSVSPRMALRRGVHPPQEVLVAGVGAEDISLARDSVVDHVEPGEDAVHDCPEDRLV